MRTTGVSVIMCDLPAVRELMHGVRSLREPSSTSGLSFARLPCFSYESWFSTASLPDTCGLGTKARRKWWLYASSRRYVPWIPSYQFVAVMPAALQQYRLGGWSMNTYRHVPDKRGESEVVGVCAQMAACYPKRTRTKSSHGARVAPLFRP